MSQPEPAEVSLEDLGNAKQQGSCVVLKNVMNLCPCEGTTSSMPGLMHIMATCTNCVSSGTGR